MNPLSTLPRPLGLLLISCCLGLGLPAMGKEKKSTPVVQCEQNGELKPCAGDNSAELEKPGKAKSFKAQADDGGVHTEKKHKRKKKKSSKKSSSKKIKAAQSDDN